MAVTVATAVLFLAVTMALRCTEAQQLPPMPKVNPVCAFADLPNIITTCYLSGNLPPSDECCKDLKSASEFQVDCLCDNFIASPANANFTRPLFDVVHSVCGVSDKFACKEGEAKKEGDSNNSNSNVGTINKAAASMSVFGLVGILFVRHVFA